MRSSDPRLPVSEGLVRVAVYRREVAASTERVWENVHDWEHLPWLHSSSFGGIELEERGDWGWRARIGLPAGGSGGTFRLELKLEPGAPPTRYVSRTLDGPGAGTEIWTTVTAQAPHRTAIEVEFWLPGVTAESKDALGAAFSNLYRTLWDEDEAMMVHRERALAETSGEPVSELDLGPEDRVEARAPLVVDWGGRPVRVVRWKGQWLAHSARCPHWLGPVEEGPDDQGRVRCPWHGYTFDPRTRASCDGRRLRLAPAPRVEVAAGRVRLVAV